MQYYHDNEGIVRIAAWDAAASRGGGLPSPLPPAPEFFDGIDTEALWLSAPRCLSRHEAQCIIRYALEGWILRQVPSQKRAVAFQNIFIRHPLIVIVKADTTVKFEKKWKAAKAFWEKALRARQEASNV